ncbi:FAD-dependent oxidoreductase [Desulfovibrio ferrophilus]|uniref:Response regulator receiver protein n=1 Tax=Desulfovibrio ferrophilus TaxID=241368 RepID=A0A2Z6B1E5_9BACT|nr:FAD-dependent oxidoreductase [Desulfovibrio ferrophilus]BBD09216.1 response regulator receiver protein [Desulfovibrio ferrophilus]
MNRKHYAALVVGAGIAGIRSALDLAESGHKVALIDKRPGIGGILTQLDHQFPSDHCGMCKMLPLTSRDSSSQFCMRKGLFHKNIDILTGTELASLTGDPGKFRATLKQHSSFVNPERCISCGECAKVCPVSVPSEFNAGLSQRTAIHLPVPHAIPNHYVVDLERCTRCRACFEACPTGAVDFKDDARPDFNVLAAAGKSIGQQLTGWCDKLHLPASLAETTDKARELLESTPMRLLLLDLTTPDIDHEKVMRRGLELYPDLRVILIIDPDQQDLAERLLDEGARDYLVTPLAAQVKRWLDKIYIRMMSDNRHELEVGSVVLAGGFECFDPAEGGQLWGYGTIPGVMTAVEFERLCSGTGPSGGQLLRPDGKPARKIGWLQCVGSRDVNRNADFCSSICCMFAIKEAMLAKRMSKGEAETTIFYMDMRTYGKDFQRYRDRAEQEQGVRFIRTRLHSIEADPNVDGVPVRYVDDKGELQTEVFDLFVLSTGARPPAKMAELAEAADIETLDTGFALTGEFQPARTSRLGVFAAGAFGQPKDIADSVIQAGAASLGAARTYKIHSPPREEQPEPIPEYRDVTREEPRMLIALCTDCPTLTANVDMESLATKLGGLSTVVHVASISNACGGAGWGEIQTLAEKHLPNRILIGACMPYAYVPRLRELGARIALDPAFMDVVDIYTPTFPGAMESGDALEREVYTSLTMAAVRLADADPSPLLGKSPVVPRALIVGGGLGGMTSAMALADQDYEVCLVERTEHLGGLAMNVHSTLGGGDARGFMEDLVDQVERHPNIKTFMNSRIMLSMGRAGRFMSAVAADEGTAVTLEHGVTILATGGREVMPDSYGYRVHKTVLRQSELEAGLNDGSLDTGALSGVAMIQCVESREEPRNYCSRVCCASALKNALTLKERNPDLPVYVFYRDIMSYGFTERFFTEARKKGVIFIRYEPTDKPRVTFDDEHRPTITATDPILGRDIAITTDLLVLSVGIDPAGTENMSEIFSVERNRDGFFQEAESKWRPVEFLRQGIFLCGVCSSPRNMSETIASAKAAASRAMRILSQETVIGGRIKAEVRASLCSTCGRCVPACPYGARSLDLEAGVAVVDELLCQGCGSCAAVCPNSASVLTGFKDGQVMREIDAALSALN